MLCGSVGCRENAVKTLGASQNQQSFRWEGRGGERKPCFHDEDRKKKKTNPKSSPARQLTLRRSVWHPLKGFWEHPVMRS